MHLLKFFVPLFGCDRNCSSRLENTINCKNSTEKPHFGHSKKIFPAPLIVPKNFAPLFYLCQKTSSRRKSTAPSDPINNESSLIYSLLKKQSLRGKVHYLSDGRGRYFCARTKFFDIGKRAGKIF